MAYKISWSDIALEDYHSIIEYLVSTWSVSVALNFEEIVNEKIEILSLWPLTGIKSEKYPGVRSILLTKQNRLYYRITSTTIELLIIIDTRSNPEKNPF